MNDTIQNPLSILDGSVTENSSIPVSNTVGQKDDTSFEKPDFVGR